MDFRSRACSINNALICSHKLGFKNTELMLEGLFEQFDRLRYAHDCERYSIPQKAKAVETKISCIRSAFEREKSVDEVKEQFKWKRVNSLLLDLTRIAAVFGVGTIVCFESLNAFGLENMKFTAFAVLVALNAWDLARSLSTAASSSYKALVRKIEYTLNDVEEFTNQLC